MATRFYFRLNDDPGITPAFHTDWNNTTGALRRSMNTEGLAGDTITGMGASSNITEKKLYRQYISGPMPAGLVFVNLSTTFAAWLACLESAANDNIVAVSRVRVVSQDGGTIRVELGGYQASGTSEFGLVRNFKRFLDITQNIGTNYTTVAGDRLVVEIGHTDLTGTTITGTVYFGADSAVSDYPGTQEDQANNTDRPWFETSVNLTFIDPVVPGAIPLTSKVKQGMIATVGDRPVQLEDWQADSTVNWGHLTLTARIPRTAVWAEQEAPVSLWLEDGSELWSGYLTQDPRSERGKLAIRAEGWANAISARKTRMFYRLDGAAAWVEAGSDPHDQILNNQNYDLFEGRGRLRVSWTDALGSGVTASFLLWLEGATIVGYTAVADPMGSYSGVDFKTRRFTGPNGARTDISTHSLNIGSPTTYTNLAISSPEDGLQFAIVTNTSLGAGRRAVILRTIKAYGRTTVDTFSASDVVIDVGGEAGLDTSLVETNGLGVLPLDWTEDHTSLLSYMAELTDWRWLARGPESLGGTPRLEFGPWDTTWTAYLANEATGTLEPMRRFNKARVPFRTVSGASRESEGTISPDPFPGKDIAFTTDELEHAQSDDTLALAVAASTAAFYSGRRLAGRVQLGRVRDADGLPQSPYVVRPGDVLNLADSGYPAQRIHSVTYRSNGDVSADLNDDFNVIRLLADLRADRPSARRRRRRRRSRNVPSPP